MAEGELEDGVNGATSIGRRLILFRLFVRSGNSPEAVGGI